MRKLSVIILIFTAMAACKKKEVQPTKRHVVIEKRIPEHVAEVTDEEKVKKEDIKVSEFTKKTETVSQKDGTSLDIVIFEMQNNSYIETTDGYTVSRNKDKVYEYMKLNDAGSLILSGVKARNEGRRSRYELKFLETHQKHLRNK